MKLNWLRRGPRTKLVFDGVLFITAGVFLNQMGDHMFPRRTIVQADIEHRYYGTFSVP